jgi:hypothetical protein
VSRCSGERIVEDRMPLPPQEREPFPVRVSRRMTRSSRSLISASGSIAEQRWRFIARLRDRGPSLAGHLVVLPATRRAVQAPAAL